MAAPGRGRWAADGHRQRRRPASGGGLTPPRIFSRGVSYRDPPPSLSMHRGVGCGPGAAGSSATSPRQPGLRHGSRPATCDATQATACAFARPACLSRWRAPRVRLRARPALRQRVPHRSAGVKHRQRRSTPHPPPTQRSRFVWSCLPATRRPPLASRPHAARRHRPRRRRALQPPRLGGGLRPGLSPSTVRGGPACPGSCRNPGGIPCGYPDGATAPAASLPVTACRAPSTAKPGLSVGNDVGDAGSPSRKIRS
jgi:hypothetical protein